MKKTRSSYFNIVCLGLFILVSGCGCDNLQDSDDKIDDLDSLKITPPYTLDEFVMGADLSYLNQILDKGGVYDSGRDPYQIFKEAGTNLVRLRVWHSPDWIKQVYQNQEEKLYSGLEDVVAAALKAQHSGMEICIDFHYSDNWADPGKQNTPVAWKNLDFETLKDSVYAYTYSSLNRLKMAGVSPAFVQIGNEINTGILHPQGHYEKQNWKDFGLLLNAGIQAVRDLYPPEDQPEIIIHIAQPENIRWFFNNLTILGQVTDYEIIGVSYYPIWSQVQIDEIDGYVRTCKKDFQKDVLIMEAAFPWTVESADSYTNIISGNDSLAGYEISKQGQLEFMKDLCQEIIDGGGLGVVYWEPGWISSNMTTQWGKGSAWENCSFFDFTSGNSVLPVVEYMMFEYNFEN